MPQINEFSWVYGLAFICLISMNISAMIFFSMLLKSKNWTKMKTFCFCLDL